MGSSVSISEIQTYFCDDGSDNRLYNYKIEVSNDRSNWVQIVSNTGKHGIVLDQFSERTVRYVRLTVLSNSANDGALIEEIKVYHVTSSPIAGIEKIGVAANDLWGNSAVKLIQP